MITNRILGDLMTKLGDFTNIIVTFPFSIILIVLTVIDLDKWPLIIIGVFFDLTWNMVGFVQEKSRSIKRFNNEIATKILKPIQFIDAEITEQYEEIIRKAYKNNDKGLCKSIKTIRSKEDMLFTTDTSVNDDTAIILVKEEFDEEEFIDQVLLAHEYGHTPQPLMRAAFYNISIYAILSSIIVISSAFMGGSCSICVAILLVNCYQLYCNFWKMKCFEESNADILALQIIETIHGQEKMHEAVYILLSKRLDDLIVFYESRIKKYQDIINGVHNDSQHEKIFDFKIFDYYAFRNYVNNIVDFASLEIKNKFLLASQKRNTKLESMNIPHKLKSLAFQAESYIQNTLKKSNVRPSSLNIKMESNSVFYIIISFLGTLIACIDAYAQSVFVCGKITLYIGILVFILLILIKIYYSKLCSKRTSYQKKILQ